MSPSSSPSAANLSIQGVNWIPMHRVISTDSERGTSPLIQVSDTPKEEPEWEIKRPMIGLALSLLGLIGAISVLSVGIASANAGEDPITLSRMTYLGYGLLIASISSAVVGSVTLNKALNAKELQLKNNLQLAV